MLVRKTVTVLFSDVVTSSAYGEQFDPESWRHLMSRYFDEMKAVIERHGGTVEKFIGDAVMAVFGVPVIHEDDALRAVRAAAEMRDRLAELNDEFDERWGVRLEMRIGVNTGEVVAGDPATGSTFVTGDAVNVGKRLEQAAEPGQILLGKATYPLVKDAVSAGPLESIPVKGKSQPVAKFRLDHVEAGVAGLARRLDTPLVGRRPELSVLREAFEGAVAEQACRLCTVLGPAGIGKSRLTGELLASLGDGATALSGRCLPYGDGITFYPLAQALEELDLESVLAGTDDADAVAERVRGTIGASAAGGGGAEETFWAVRKLVEAVARPRPLVLCFEDIHWAEPTLLDLIEYLAGWIRDAPVLLLCLARPDLLELRPSWSTPRTNATVLALEPLSGAESEQLLETLQGDTELAAQARARIAEAAEGNPLFVEQMLAMAAEEDSGGRELRVPPSIQALLAERLDRLGTEERAVIERASVVGKEFPRGAVLELSPPSLRPAVGSHLMVLVRKDLIQPDTSSFAREDGFRFRHALIRDAAYEGIPKEIRADLHARFAEWMRRFRGGTTKLEEIRGYHLEQAYRLREQLGPLDDDAHELGRRAAELLGSAGQRAFARGDMHAAVTLIDRTLALLPPGDPAALPLLPDLGLALKESGELARAEAVLTQAVEEAVAARERRVELRASIERAALRLLSDPEGQTEEALDLLEGAIPTLEEVGDDRALATAWYLIGLTRGLWHGRFAVGEEALERALGHARSAGDRRQEGAIIGWLAFAALTGPTPVEEAILRCETLLEGAKGDRIAEAGTVRSLSTLEAKRGRFDEARELIGRAREIYEDLGMPLTAVAATTFACGHLELLADDFAAAEDQLRRGYDAFEGMGEKGYLSSVAALLAEALYGQNRFDEAERFTETAHDAAASDDISSQINLRATRAKLLARRGSHDEAVTLAREAVTLAETTDALDMHGDALLDLAHVLRLGGHAGEAVECARGALELYERKGNVVSAEKARALLGTAVGV